uniref:PERIANTHIA family protein n=1 Tax=Populus alba TaxID=43335 RepID=A0A4U5QVC8_POPAL|nr:PERIANTHIA family protein [Populus alba]
MLINAANVFCFCFYNLSKSIGSAEISTTGARCLETGQYMYQKGTGFDSSLGNGQSNENWGDSGMADNSLQTDTSTDVNTDDKNQLRGVPHGADMVVNSMDQSKGRTSDQKTLRRLAQNREAARRGRLRKKVLVFGKAYVQQLENSRLRLTQLEQELQRARQQFCKFYCRDFFIASGFCGDHGHSMDGNGKGFWIYQNGFRSNVEHS